MPENSEPIGVIDEMSPSHEAFLDAIKRGVDFSLANDVERFGPSQPVENRLPFHNVDHSIGVGRRTRLIVDTIQDATGMFSDRELAIPDFIAASHDTVQQFDLVEGQFEGRPILERKRHIGINEKDTISEALGFMDSENAKNPGSPVFLPEDVEVVEQSIDRTVPVWDTNLGTVVQPTLGENVRAISTAVPLADLGSSGIDGAEATITDNDKIFLEDNVDVARLFDSGKPIDNDTAEWLKRRILVATESQVTFVQGRQRMLDQELAHLPEAAQNALKEKVFNKFDEAITGIKNELAWRQQASTEEVIAKLRKQMPLPEVQNAA